MGKINIVNNMEKVNGYVVEQRYCVNNWSGLILGFFANDTAKPLIFKKYERAYKQEENAYMDDAGFHQFRVRKLINGYIKLNKHGAYFVIKGFEQ